MLKKIALVLMLALPMGVFAQNLKFGHINAQEIVSAMPEFAKAQSDIEALDKQLTSELQRTQEEFNKKYQEFQQAIAKDSLPANIAERRQKELQDMMQRQEQFQQEAQQQMQKAQADAMAPIYKKLDDAIKAVVYHYPPDQAARIAVDTVRRFLEEGELIESHYLVERRNRTIYKRMREYLYELKHHPQLMTSIIPLGDGVSLSVKEEV